MAYQTRPLNKYNVPPARPLLLLSLSPPPTGASLRDTVIVTAQNRAPSSPTHSSSHPASPCIQETSLSPSLSPGQFRDARMRVVLVVHIHKMAPLATPQHSTG